MREVKIERQLAAELENNHANLGTAAGPSSFVATIADQPIGYRLKDVIRSLGQEQQSGLRLLDEFDVWLIPHRVGLVRRRGFAEVTSVGIEVEYDANGGTCSVAGLFPTSQYITLGEVGFDCKASMTLGGEIVPDALVAPSVARSLGALRLSASTGGSVGMSMRAVVNTPRISAVGIGSKRAEWLIDKDKEPLFGRDIECWSSLVLPKGRTTVGMRLRFYCVLRLAFFPTRWESEWVDVCCRLCRL